MIEKNMQSFFTKHVSLNPPKQTEAYELKITSTGRLSFDALQAHQAKALMEAEDAFLYHKITDQPWLPDRPYSFTSKKPFDCFALVGVKSYVVVWFYTPRKPKIFIKIPIKVYLEEQKTSIRKSLTEERAYQLGEAIHITNAK